MQKKIIIATVFMIIISSFVSIFSIKCVAQNQPPFFGIPSPENNSTNNTLDLSWSIPINDSEGNLFSWSIECSNGQVTSGTDAPNGTKSLSLSGLAYSTMYKVWVNATDPAGSGLYTRSWYTFSTKQANSPPVFGAPSPVNNGSTGNLLSLSWGIPINDSEGNLFSWSIECSNGQVTSGTDAPNGTKSLSLSGLAYSTMYKVWVNATDPAGSGLYTRSWYTFSTKQANSPPVFGAPSPVNNGSTWNSLSFSWRILINDPDNDSINWTIQCSNGQTNSGTGASNGTKSLFLSPLTNSKTYKVWVNATDPTGSGLWTRRWYTFTTAVYYPPVTPPSTENQKPVADLSAGEPYQGFVNSEITFDGSKSYDSDGNITKWSWVFGDNTIGTGKIAPHIYSKKGTYTVTLTVTDNEGATNNDTTTCIITQMITQPNRPPTKPTISGTITGPTNTEYEYTVVSIDPDNDLIKYTFNWSESGSQSSQFLPSGTRFTVNHSWTIPGQYLLTVTVTDNQTESYSYLKINIHAGEKEPQKTPGFDFILLILAITSLIIWKRKRRESN